MTDITDITAALTWKLLAGSHKFPGPEGGTCINEAAIVVAGLQYRRIGSIGDCPSCFSQPVAAYAMALNDRMPEDLRQELLLPFVTRFADSADAPAIERKRANLIALLTTTDVLSLVLRMLEREDLAQLCERAKSMREAHAAAAKVRDALRVPTVDATAAAAHVAATSYADADYDDVAAAVVYAADAAAAAAHAGATTAAHRQIWIRAAAILDAALRIGKHAEPIEQSAIAQRAEEAKRQIVAA
jgi:hypothetical protein